VPFRTDPGDHSIQGFAPSALPFERRLVDDRREGVWMHYRLADDMGPERRSILDAIRASMSDTSLDELRQKLAASRERRSPPRAAAAPRRTHCRPRYQSSRRRCPLRNEPCDASP